VRERGWTIVALGALVFAYAFLIQPTGDNQKAHYALVRALAEGRPYVDEVRTNPHLRTIDVTEHDGHVYAAKSPGYAMFSLPAYVVLERLGVDTDGDTKRILWALHLWATVLPALVVLLLVKRLADDVEPGFGVLAAVTLGAATLVLPFGTLYFSHLLTAALVLGAFALLWFRPGARELATVAAAGLLLGLAVTSEASTAIAAFVLGAYAAVGAVDRGWAANAAAFALGFVIGVAPSPAFNWWALGSPFRTPYEGWHYPGQPVASGSFGFGTPSLRALVALLLYPTGLVLLAAAVAGTILLLRRRRREATVILVIAVAFLLANSMSPDVFGGAAPGPRYLVPIFPLLAVGLAVAYRRLRAESVGLALAGAAMLGAATITSPLASLDQRVLQRLRDHSVVGTALDFVGIRSGFAVLIFVAAVLLAVAAAWRASNLTLAARELPQIAVVGAAFAVVATQVPRLVDARSSGAELLAAVLLAAAAAAVVLGSRRVALSTRSSVRSVS
jgi:hypothetical protein